MEKFCKTLSIVFLVLGFIGSIALSSGNGFTIFLIYLLSVGLLCLFIYWMGEVAGRLQDIVSRLEKPKAGSTTSTSSTSLYNKDNSWVCKKCGKQNFNYYTSCECGLKKEDNFKSL